jgi:uncharacterized protein (DUF2336 family)
MSDRLTAADVEELLSDRSVEARTKAASKISGEYSSGSLTESERKIAEDIFRTLARDIELRVRQALAEQLKESRLVPREIALTLARDVSDVSLPILEFSDVLTDEDLIAVVHSQDGAKQVAIARRRRVSAPVADALIDSKNAEAVAELVANDGAELSEASLQIVLDRYGEEEAVKRRMAFRYALPSTIAERLVTVVSERLRQHLMANQQLPPDAVSDLIQFSRERATLGMVWGAGAMELERFVRQLHSHNRLTPTLLLRALCMGDTLFFETGISVRANVPMRNAVALIYDKGQRGFKALYEKAGLPPQLFSAFEIAVNVARQTELDGLAGDRERYRQRVIERILTQFEAIGADNIEYLLAKLGRHGHPQLAVAN